MPTHKTRSLLPLAAIALFAFALRLWNINFGLPYLYHPDEPRYINIGLHLFQTTNFDPHAIPELSINALIYVVNGLVYALYYAIGHGLGLFNTPQDIAPLEFITYGTGRAALPTLVLVSRVIVALFGTGATLLLYAVGNRIGRNRWVGPLAALLLAISPGNVIHSKFVVPDEILVFFVCLTLWCTLQLVQQGRTIDYLLAGATLGLAISTKLTGAILLLPLTLAHLWRHRWQSVQQPKLYLALLAMLVAFALSTPFVLVDPAKVWADWQLERSHYALGHVGMEGDTVAWYLQYLWNVEGPVTLLAVIGLLLGLLQRNKFVAIFGALLIVYLTIVGTQPVRNDRTILTILPVVSLFAAYALGELITLWQAQTIQGRKIALVYLALLIVGTTIGWPLTRTIAKNIELGTQDGRALAQAWLPDHLPPGTKVAVESYSPFVDPAIYDVQGFFQLREHPPAWYVEQNFDYLIFSEGMFGRFYREPERYAAEIATYEAFFAQFHLVERFDDAGYSISFVDSGYEIRVYQVK